MPKKARPVNIDNTDTWTKYKAGLCNGCKGFCCRLPVEATVDDLIRMEVLDPFDANEKLKRIARKLKDSGVVEHYNPGRAKFTLARRPNTDCIYLHPKQRICTIYDKRPEVCRNHPQIGPRPGYCPHEEQE